METLLSQVNVLVTMETLVIQVNVHVCRLTVKYPQIDRIA